jgi:membrane-bound ClpP family serine protease
VAVETRSCRTTLTTQLVPNSCTRLKVVLMIILGIILLIAGFVLKISILWTIGIILLIIGVVLALMGSMGRAVGGRRHYF